MKQELDLESQKNLNDNLEKEKFKEGRQETISSIKKLFEMLKANDDGTYKPLDSRLRCALEDEIEYFSHLIEEEKDFIESAHQTPEDFDKMMRPKLYMELNQLIFSDISEPEWIVKDFISEHGVTLFFGEPKSSKTILAVYLALCVANEIDFLGQPVKQGRVLYIDEENGKYSMKDKFKRVAEAFSLSLSLVRSNNFLEYIDMFTNNIDLMIFKNIKLEGSKASEWQKNLKEYIEERKPTLVIIDSLVRFMEGDENSANDIRKVFEFIKPFKNKTCFLILHHTPKGGSTPRGSGDIEAQVDDSFIITRKNKFEHKFNIRTNVTRSPNLIDVSYKLVGEEKKPIELVIIGKNKEEPEFYDDEREIIHWIQNKKCNNFRASDIKSELKQINDTARIKALKTLIDFGAINRIGKTNAGKYSVNTNMLDLFCREKLKEMSVESVEKLSN